MRLVGDRGGFDQARVKRKPPHQRELAGILQSIKRCGREHGRARRVIARQVRNGLARIAEYGLRAGMAVLDVKYRVVAGLLDHLGQIEIEHRVVFAVEHHEADRVLADLVHDFT